MSNGCSFVAGHASAELSTVTYYALNDWVERVVEAPAKPGQRRAVVRASEKPPGR